MSADETRFRATPFPLGSGRPPIVLESRGIHHPSTPRGSGSTFTAYEDVTHIAATSRALWLGTRRSVYAMPRRLFDDPTVPEAFLAALVERIAARPGGLGQLAAMRDIEAVSHTPTSLRATLGLAAACLFVYAVHLLAGPNVHDVGYFNAALVRDGDWWRLVTGNLLHGVPEFPLHLVLNLLGLLALGHLVERPMGSARTACILGASALGAMEASGYAGYASVVGASGVVFGLAGSVVWLEYRRADHLPAWWRFPRRTLLFFLGLNAAIMFLVPVIAGAAHVGGFFAGMLATALLCGDGLRPRVPVVAVRALAAGFVAIAVAAVGAAGVDLFGSDDFESRYVARLARMPEISPLELNNRAWVIAIDPESTRAEIESALLLAERAAVETERREPTILDTLAEVQFQLGLADEAVSTIDEAILQAPGERYYMEQRRRFTGEREPADRPDAPLFEPPRAPEIFLPGPVEPGITV